MNRKPQITLIGDSEATREQYKISYAVGKKLADLEVIALTGGRGDVMEAVARGVRENKGLCIGILPSENHADGNTYNTVTIPTGIGYSRNSVTVLAGAIVIAIGGGAGTLSEMAFAWMYNKPVIAYGKISGWAKQLAGKKLDKRQNDTVLSFSNIPELENLLLETCQRLHFKMG